MQIWLIENTLLLILIKAIIIAQKNIFNILICILNATNTASSEDHKIWSKSSSFIRKYIFNSP